MKEHKLQGFANKVRSNVWGRDSDRLERMTLNFVKLHALYTSSAAVSAALSRTLKLAGVIASI